MMEGQVIRPVITKKVIVEAHAGHHGGAWKVAYADFVTAMMAFFLLMWLLGSTTEKQRKGLADYFSPTLVQSRQSGGGSTGLFGGDSIVSADSYAHRPSQTGTRALTIPKDATGGILEGGKGAEDRKRFDQVRKTLKERLLKDRQLARYAKRIRLTETAEGLRIDLVDEADFSMFFVGSDTLTPDAVRLLPVVASALRDVPNQIKVRGHTDAAQFTSDPRRNNWVLSSARAEATRRVLDNSGISPARFSRIEGVADREPYKPGDPFAPVNRRMSIILGWS